MSSPVSITKCYHGGTADTVDLKSTVLKDMGVRVPLVVPAMKKPKTVEIRNPFALPAKARKSGKMRPKDEKRQNGKNKQREYLAENY